LQSVEELDYANGGKGFFHSSQPKKNKKGGILLRGLTDLTGAVHAVHAMNPAGRV
jgi:hypothetical protein